MKITQKKSWAYSLYGVGILRYRILLIFIHPTRKGFTPLKPSEMPPTVHSIQNAKCVL